MSLCVSPWVYPLWGSLHFLELTISFPMLGKFSTIISSKYFSDPFSYFSSLVFLDHISPFKFVVKLVWWYWILLTFTCLKSFLFLHQFWMRSLLGNLDCRFFPFSTLNISCYFLLACRVSAERSAVMRMGFPLYVTCCFSLAAFNSLSLCLVFVSLISMCGRKEPDTTEWLHFHFHTLEKEMATHSSVLAWGNPRDGGAWWAAVCGVT